MTDKYMCLRLDEDSQRILTKAKTERYTVDEGYQILLEMYKRLINIYDLFGMYDATPVKNRWCEIFDEVESEVISNYLGCIRELVVGVLDDYEHGKILPYSRRVEMEGEE